MLILAPGATLAQQDIGCVHRIACHGTVRFVGMLFQRVFDVFVHLLLPAGSETEPISSISGFVVVGWHFSVYGSNPPGVFAGGELGLRAFDLVHEQVYRRGFSHWFCPLGVPLVLLVMEQ